MPKRIVAIHRQLQLQLRRPPPTTIPVPEPSTVDLPQKLLVVVPKRLASLLRRSKRRRELLL
jgi:hypothetical protein